MYNFFNDYRNFDNTSKYVHVFFTQMSIFSLFRWQKDPLCDGMNYPKNFSEVQRTLQDYNKIKYGKSPTTGEEIQLEFSKPHVFEELGKSKHHERGIFFNTMQIANGYQNCIFSSAKSIALIKYFTNEENRFFLMDGTFRSTPRGIFQQVLILHFQFGIKVIDINLIIFFVLNSYFSRLIQSFTS